MLSNAPARTPIAAPLIAALLALAGCGSSDPGWPPEQTDFALTPVPISTEIVVGQNRLLFNILGSDNLSIADPDTRVELRFYDLAASRTEPEVTASAEYTPTTEGRPGLYRADVELTSAGNWGVDATATDAAGSESNGRFVFSVRESGTTPAIGAPAVASVNPTAATVDEASSISTDAHPDPDFYLTTPAAALADSQPFALVFATPAFCASAMCAPTLDTVKSVAADFKGAMSFIHVEPYELKMVDGHLQPVLTDTNLPISVPATESWGLPTEPYIFVVNGAGQVTAKFEGVAAADELRAAFAEVART